MNFSHCSAFSERTQNNSYALQLGEALSCRASPLYKQSTGLFINSPLAERTLCFWGLCPHTPVTLLKKGQSKTFIILTRFITFAYCVALNEKSPSHRKVCAADRLWQRGILDMHYLSKRTVQKNYGFQRFAEPRQNRRPTFGGEVILSSGLEAKADKTLSSMRRA